MAFDLSFIDKIEKKLSEDLPGESAQYLMSPPYHDHYRKLTQDYRTACVLLLMFPRHNQWHIALIERSHHQEDDKHAGQLSLPGGKLDENDYSLEDCALRETYEEIGVPPESIGILGALSPLFVFVSNFLVHPFVGFTTDSPKFLLQKSEVADLIEVPVSHFLDDSNKSKADIRVRDIIIPEVPYYKIKDKQLWGATAMIMSEWEQVLAAI